MSSRYSNADTSIDDALRLISATKNEVTRAVADTRNGVYSEALSKAVLGLDAVSEVTVSLYEEDTRLSLETLKELSTMFNQMSQSNMGSPLWGGHKPVDLAQCAEFVDQAASRLQNCKHLGVTPVYSYKRYH